MSDNELDNLFKEAADEFKAPSDPSAWQDMTRRLDQAAVVTSFWNWKTISSLTAVGIISTALVLYLSMPDVNTEKIAAADGKLRKVIVEEKNADGKPAAIDQEVNSTTQNLKDNKDLVEIESEQSKKADQSKKLDQSNGNAILKEENSDRKSTDNDKNKKLSSTTQSLTDKKDLVERESDQRKKADQSKELDQSNSRSKALAIESADKSKQGIKTNENPVQNENLAEIQTKPSQQKTQSLKQESPDQNQAGVSKNSTNNNQGEVVGEVVNADRKPEKQVALVAEVVVLGKSLDSKDSGSSVMEGNSNQSASNTKAANPQIEKSSTNIDSLKKEEEKKELVTSTVSKTEEQPDEQKKKPEVTNRFAIKLAISPDYSTVKSAAPNSLGINYGVLFEYKLSERWSVATGGIWSKKIYSANDVEYNGHTADWVDGDCRMWDIPINVYYNFPSHKQFSFYASVGLSSYLMNEENYVYYVESSYGTYDYAMQVKGENNEWFKTLNVSAGMQVRMNKVLSLQFEPTLKAPLAGVGEGEVSLVSLGAFLNLRFDLPINKPGRNED